MATRMQQRRGTAAQWISTNSGNGPILAAGEIGFESDTNKFKVGDGVNHWVNLDYFIDANSTVNPAFGSSIVFEGATANAFETTVQVTDPTADRTITLPDATGTVVLSDGSGNVTVSGNLTVSGTTTTINSTTINATTGIVFEGTTANDFETTLTVEDPTADRTITFPDATGTVALIETVNTSLGGYVETSDIGGVSGVAGLDSSLNLIVPGSSIIIEGATDNAFETTLVVTDPTADRTLTLPDSNGTLTTQTYVDNLALAHTNATTNVHGILDTNSLATQTYADTAVSIHSQDTTDVHGIPNTSLLTTTTNTQTLTNKTLTSPKINEDVALTATSTTLNYVAGVTSDIQTQLNNKQAVVANVSDTEIGYLDGVTSSIQTQITAGVTALSNHEADTTSIHGIADTSLLVTTTGTQTLTNKTLTGPTITIPAATTNVYGPSTASYGFGANASSSPTFIYASKAILSAMGWPVTDEGYVGKTLVISGSSNTSYNGSWVIDSVTVEETQLKFYGSSFASKGHGAISSCTVTLQQTIAEKTISSTEISYIDGVTSAIQTQLDAKATTASPTFTGTVTLPTGTVTSGMIADGAVVNADINASAAISQSKIDGLTTDLAAKLALAGGTMTGALTLSGAPSSDLHAATKLYVDNVTSGINFHQAVHAASVNNLAANYSNGTSGVGATLTADSNRAFSTLDGESVVVGQRVLIKNQTDAKQNGIYTLTTNGSVSEPWVLTRATDADNNPSGEMKNGDFTFVQAGTVNASIGYINNSTANPIVIGTDNISYTEFNAAKTVVAGNGLQEATPGILSIDTAITATKASVDLKAPIDAPTFTGTVTVSASGVVFTDGTQTKEGVASRTAIVQKTASYTLSELTHRDSLIEVSSSSGVTVSIPTDATLNYPIGTSIDILQTGTGQITIAAVTPGTTTVNATPGLKLRTQWSSCTLFKRAANTWIVMGDLAV